MRAVWPGALLALSLAATASARDIERVEVVGAVAVLPGAATSSAREAAVRRALREAVNRTALALLAQLPVSEDGAGIELSGVLGADPLEYASRYQVIEDRGERPALFVTDPDAVSEYVVVVEVYLDLDRVRDRLRAAGLELAPSGEDRLDDDQETQFLLRTIAQDERSTLEFFADACKVLS